MPRNGSPAGWPGRAWALIAGLLLWAGLPGTALAQRYAAIAYSESTGKYGYSYRYCSRAAAERAALRECKAPDAKVVVWAKNNWCALALAADGDSYGYAWKCTAADAKARALKECRKFTPDCYVAVVVSSGGTVREYDPPRRPDPPPPPPRPDPPLPRRTLPDISEVPPETPRLVPPSPALRLPKLSDVPPETPKLVPPPGRK